jgi:sec-independent protein translocase protein TatA
MLGFVLLLFDIGGGELILILIVALILFGGDKLPELARGLGKGIRDFKDASEGVKREITNQIDSFEAKKAAEADDKKAADEAKKREEAAKNEPAPEKPLITPATNAMPLADMSAPAETEPVTNAEQEHLKETPIERFVEEPEKTEHNEPKS